MVQLRRRGRKERQQAVMDQVVMHLKDNLVTVHLLLIHIRLHLEKDPLASLIAGQSGERLVHLVVAVVVMEMVLEATPAQAPRVRAWILTKMRINKSNAHSEGAEERQEGRIIRRRSSNVLLSLSPEDTELG